MTRSMLVLALAIGVCLATGVSCSDRYEERAGFVEEYVQSVHAGSELSHRITPLRNHKYLDEWAASITDRFEISGYDDQASGRYSFAVSFGNGRRGMVVVQEAGDSVQWANLRVAPPDM